MDHDAFARLIENAARLGCEGVLVAGTTGEVATLNEFEHRNLIHAAVELASGQLQVMAGVGGNCTRRTVEMARFAERTGVDSLLAVTPYYNKPNQRGLLLHYGLLAEAVEAPIVLYNVPGRTSVDLAVETAAELDQRHENIVAIKEASGSPARIAELVQASSLQVLCGDDGTLAESVAAGAVGAVSVIANVCDLPQLLFGPQPDIVEATREGLQAEFAELLEALALDVNPVPIKLLLADLGLCGAEVRPPLAPMPPEARARLLEVWGEHLRDESLAEELLASWDSDA